MSNLKRFLAMTLVMFMMIGALAMSASAKFFDDVEALKDVDLSNAVALLSSLGIARGTSEDTFDPDSDVTREQFAMFVGRIHTGTPDYFLLTPGYEPREKDLTVFSDVNGKDPLWYLPINYCYDNNIITGLTSPTDEAAKDGVFGLGDNIIFQDAVTMLVRSLGYHNAGLAYPVGFLAKAREIGLLDNFDGKLLKMRAQDIVSRADMAMLLYNYFMSDFYEVNLIWNQTSAQHVERVSYRPVSEKFGITKVEGYVTAIEGASLPMWVEDPYAGTVLGAGGRVTDLHWVNIGTNDPISMRNATATNAGHFDIIISWVTAASETTTKTTWTVVEETLSGGRDPFVYAKQETVSTNNRVVGHLRTTKSDLGLAEDYAGLEGSRYLLGLKVVVFLNTSNREVNLPPPVVIGEKVRAETSTIDGDMLAADGWAQLLNNFTFNGTDGSKHVFNQYNIRAFGDDLYLNDNWTAGDIGGARRDEGDINYYTGYVFTSDTSRPITERGLARQVNTTANSSLSLLARIIQTKNADLGAMDIDVIDNGFNKDGTPNRYVIFTPYEARYIRDVDAGHIRTYRGNGHQENIINNTAVRKIITADTTYAASSLTNGRAYYLNDQGEYILRGKELVEVTANNTLGTVTHTTNRVATFEVGVASSALAGSFGNVQIDFGHNDVFYRTLYNRAEDRSSRMNGGATGDTNAYAIAQYATFKIFTLGVAPYNYGFVGQNHGSFFVWRDNDNAKNPDRRYGYILSEIGSLNMVGGQSVTQYSVFNTKTGTSEVVLDIGPMRNINLRQGTHVVYQTVGFNTPNTHEILGAAHPLMNTTTPISNTLDLPIARTVKLAMDRFTVLDDDGNPDPALQTTGGMVAMNTLRTNLQNAINASVAINLSNFGTVRAIYATGDSLVQAVNDLLEMMPDDAPNALYLAELWADIRETLIANLENGSGNNHMAAFPFAGQVFVNCYDYNLLFTRINTLLAATGKIADWETNHLVTIQSGLTTNTPEIALYNISNDFIGALRTYLEGLRDQLIATRESDRIERAIVDTAISSQFAIEVGIAWTQAQVIAEIRRVINDVSLDSGATVGNISVGNLLNVYNTTGTYKPTVTYTVTVGNQTSTITNQPIDVVVANLATASIWGNDLANVDNIWSGAGIPATGVGNQTAVVGVARGFIYENNARTKNGRIVVDTFNGIGNGNGFTFDTQTSIATVTSELGANGLPDVGTTTATVIAGYTQIVIFDVNNLNTVNTISLADFRTLMTQIRNTRSAVKSAMVVANMSGIAEALYVGLDTAAAAPYFAQKPTNPGGNPSGVGQYIITSINKSEMFTFGGTTYWNAKARDTIDWAKEYDVAVATYGTNIDVGSWVYVTSTVAKNTSGQDRPVVGTNYNYGDYELTREFVNTIIASGLTVQPGTLWKLGVSNQDASDRNDRNGISGISVRDTNGMTYYNNGNMVAYIELTVSGTSVTKNRTHTYSGDNDRTATALTSLTTPSNTMLRYDNVKASSLNSNAAMPGAAGTTYIVPQAGGGFVLVNILIP